MPINPNALSGAQSEASESEVEERITQEREAEAQQVEQTRQEIEAAQPAVAETSSVDAPKRTRRTKAQMIADAVIPAETDVVELKDAGTGAKIERQWLVALELVRDGKAEFADKAMKYSMLKWDQMQAQGAFHQPAAADSSGTPAENVAKSISIPPDAEVGDEVVRGADVFRVGHDRTLTTGPISVDGEIVQPKRRWQRELGSGVEGPWEAKVLSRDPAPKPAALGEDPVVDALKAETNGNGGAPQVETLPAGVSIEPIADGAWKVGTGILEKIGLPDYSSLQIGPISASRTAVDDGRRSTVMIGDREAQIPTAVVEIAREAMDIVEYIARYQRGELVSFLESTGAIKSSVS
jgi:hypothetical protein